VHIRAAEPAEQGALDELHKRSSYVWEQDRANLEAHPDALGVAPDAIAEGRVHVAIGPGENILGFSVVAFATDTVCELDDLFVAPEFMRQGVGRALVAGAAARASLAGCLQMTVVAHPRNFPFYEAVGFVAGEATDTRFGPAVQMRRGLSSGCD